MFSIGPIHHGKHQLRRGEELKLQLLKLLSEENSELLRTFVGQCYDCVHIAREQYPANIQLSDKEFVEMLVVDGCFVIMFLVSYRERRGDIIKTLGCSFTQVWSDLLLLENQIPFFVIEKFLLKSISFLGVSLVYDAFLPSTPFVSIQNLLPRNQAVLHLLHLQQILLDSGDTQRFYEILIQPTSIRKWSTGSSGGESASSSSWSTFFFLLLRVIFLGLSFVATPNRAAFEGLVFFAFLLQLMYAAASIFVVVICPVVDSLALRETVGVDFKEFPFDDYYSDGNSLVPNNHSILMEPGRSSDVSAKRGSISFRNMIKMDFLFGPDSACPPG